MEKTDKKTRSKLEDYAAKPVLVLSGSLLVLSVALNNIGFKEVIDAWAKSIAANIEQKCNTPKIEQSIIDQVNFNAQTTKENADLIESLALDSHKPSGK